MLPVVESEGLPIVESEGPDLSVTVELSIVETEDPGPSIICESVDGKLFDLLIRFCLEGALPFSATFFAFSSLLDHPFLSSF